MFAQAFKTSPNQKKHHSNPPITPNNKQPLNSPPPSPNPEVTKNTKRQKKDQNLPSISFLLPPPSSLALAPFFKRI